MRILLLKTPSRTLREVVREEIARVSVSLGKIGENLVKNSKSLNLFPFFILLKGQQFPVHLVPLHSQSVPNLLPLSSKAGLLDQLSQDLFLRLKVHCELG